MEGGLDEAALAGMERGFAGEQAVAEEDFGALEDAAFGEAVLLSDEDVADEVGVVEEEDGLVTEAEGGDIAELAGEVEQEAGRVATEGSEVAEQGDVLRTGRSGEGRGRHGGVLLSPDGVIVAGGDRPIGGVLRTSLGENGIKGQIPVAPDLGREIGVKSPSPPN